MPPPALPPEPGDDDDDEEPPKPQRITHPKDRHLRALRDKVEEMKSHSLVLGRKWGHDLHHEQRHRWRSRRTVARRQERLRHRERRERRAASVAATAADAAAAGTSGWLARRDARLSLDAAELEAAGADGEGEEEDSEFAEEERRRRLEATMGHLGESTRDFRAGGGWASQSHDGLTPGWSTHALRPGFGPVGGVHNALKHQVKRSFNRGATETLAVEHSAKHPHNSPMLHGHREQPLRDQHKHQGGGEVDLGVKFQFARAHRAPDGYQSRGSGCVAVGRTNEFRLGSERLSEMLTELTLRCALTKEQARACGTHLASFAASGDTFIGYGRFVEIAKCAGISEADMDKYKQLFQAFDSNHDSKLDLEELCDGLAYFKRRTLRSKLRLLYTMWCGQHCDHSEHGGYYEAGLSKFQVYGLLSALMGADLKVSTELRNRDRRSRSSSAAAAVAAKPALTDASLLSRKELALLEQLFAAVATDDVPTIQTLLAKGARLDVRNPQGGRTPLEQASEDGKDKAHRCIKAWMWQQEKEAKESAAKHARRGSGAISAAMSAATHSKPSASTLETTVEAAAEGEGEEGESDQEAQEELDDEVSEPEQEEEEEEEEEEQAADNASSTAAAAEAQSRAPPAPEEWGVHVFDFLTNSIFVPLDPHGKGDMSLETLYREVSRSERLAGFIQEGAFPSQSQLDLSRNDWAALYADFYAIGLRLREQSRLRGKIRSQGAAGNTKEAQMTGLETLHCYELEVSTARRDQMHDIDADSKTARRMPTTWRDQWHARHAPWRRGNRAADEKFEKEVHRMMKSSWKSRLSRASGAIKVAGTGFKGKKKVAAPTDICYHCKQPGHWKQDCPLLHKEL